MRFVFKLKILLYISLCNKLHKLWENNRFRPTIKIKPAVRTLIYEIESYHVIFGMHDYASNAEYLEFGTFYFLNCLGSMFIPDSTASFTASAAVLTFF